LATIFRKELADYFTGIKFIIFSIIVLGISALAIVSAMNTIRSGDTSSDFVFLKLFTSAISDNTLASLLIYPYLLAFFVIPLVGIVLGFDAVNSERSRGTLSRLMAQPIYRDNIINAKFLAGIFVLTSIVVVSMLLIAGYGLRMIGVPPGAEEIIRLFIFAVFTIIYGAFWMGLAILFSTLFNNVASSMLVSLFLWIVFVGIVIIILVTSVITDVNLLTTLLHISPAGLFFEIVAALLTPAWRGTQILSASSDTTNFMLSNPLSLGQSLLTTWPQIVTIIAITLICFAISYIVFMRQEVRST
jgi:ABC-2 type transport system permease protein